ncbi:unnamed protein product [Coregonus sp. 'balchen']|nr:unnamed protein product [Coregonus sp. 'balchen']
MEENGGVEECVKAGDPRGTDAVRGACKDVGSVSNIILEMRFNPSVFSLDVTFPKSDREAVTLQERLKPSRYTRKASTSNAFARTQGPAQTHDEVGCGRYCVAHCSTTPAGEEPKKRSGRRGRRGAASDSTAWSALSGAELRNLIGQDAAETYDITHSLGSTADHLVETYGLQKNSAQKGVMDQVYEYLKEAAYLLGCVCDNLNPEGGSCLSLMARVAYLRGQQCPAQGCETLQLRIQQAVHVERSLRPGGDPLTAEGQSLSPSAETTLEQLALVAGIRTPSHSDRLLEFKQKLMEQRGRKSSRGGS